MRILWINNKRLFYDPIKELCVRIGSTSQLTGHEPTNAHKFSIITATVWMDSVFFSRLFAAFRHGDIASIFQNSFFSRQLLQFPRQF